MSKKVVVAFDKDDTLCQTGAFINATLKKYFKDNGMKDYHAYIERKEEENVSTFRYSDEIRKYTDELVIGPGHYMLEAKPTQLAVRLIEEKAKLMAMFPDVIWVVCTHRGFHKDGERFTKSWVKRKQLDDLLTKVHAIDGQVYPDKIDYLREMYPDHEILLVDDNPLHDINKEHPYRSEILLYTGVHALPAYKNQATYYGIDGLISSIRAKRKESGGY